MSKRLRRPKRTRTVLGNFIGLFIVLGLWSIFWLIPVTLAIEVIFFRNGVTITIGLFGSVVWTCVSAFFVYVVPAFSWIDSLCAKDDKLEAEYEQKVQIAEQQQVFNNHYAKFNGDLDRIRLLMHSSTYGYMAQWESELIAQLDQQLEELPDLRSSFKIVDEIE